MKTIQKIMLLILAVTTLASCQEAARVPCELDVTVTLEDGTPVEGASVQAGYTIGTKPNYGGGFPQGVGERKEARSNASGKAKLAFRSLDRPSAMISVEKPGFYKSGYRELAWKEISPGSNSWEFQLTAIIKPIKNPIPMIATEDVRFPIRQFGIDYGFDLELRKLTPPYGEGKVADLIFRLTGSRRDIPRMQEDAETTIREAIDFKMEIRCLNPDDGLIEFVAEDSYEFQKGSFMISSNEAPADGYIAFIQRSYSIGEKGAAADAASWELHSNRNRCCYFRVRTKKNDQGQIVSANYGKMYGPLEIAPALKLAGHDPSKGEAGFKIHHLYFNPTSNDRNVEFDVEKNLNKEGNVQHP